MNNLYVDGVYKVESVCGSIETCNKLISQVVILRNISLLRDLVLEKRDGSIITISEGNVVLKKYFSLKSENIVDEALRGFPFNCVVALNQSQVNFETRRIAKERNIELEIHNDIKGFQYIHFSLDDDTKEKILEHRPVKVLKGVEKILEDIQNFTTEQLKKRSNKRLPDEVIFKNGKTTLLFSVNNDGKRPYVPYSSNTAKGDTFDKEFGLLITYLKYLKEDYKDVLKECFDFKGKARLSFLYGVVRQLCDNHNISIEDLQQFSIHILNNERYTLKQYNDWKREIESKAKCYVEVTNAIEDKEKELEKLKKQKESLK